MINRSLKINGRGYGLIKHGGDYLVEGWGRKRAGMREGGGGEDGEYFEVTFRLHFSIFPTRWLAFAAALRVVDAVAYVRRRRRRRPDVPPPRVQLLL